MIKNNFIREAHKRLSYRDSKSVRICTSSLKLDPHEAFRLDAIFKLLKI